jgi:hypothetical protein
VFRNYFAVLAAQQEYNYEGDLTDREFSVGLFTTLRNFWGFSAFTIRTPETFDDRATRGGPVVKRFGYRYYSTSISTDARRKLSFSFSPNYTAREKYADNYNLNLTATLKPSSNIQISLGPSYSKSWSTAQFVTSGADSTNTAFFGRRYIFAGLEQKSLSMSTRVNVTFTPELTLEGYAQPLIAAGDYRRFREFVAPRQSAIRDFEPSQLFSTSEDGARRYTVDVDGAGPAQPISFFDPNFNFRSLRGNAVLRWEYRPGSTLYFVWQQTRAQSVPLGNFDFSRDREALFNAHPDNIFLVKATYWVAF